MHQLFQRLGLTEKETRTFLTLLELGAQPVSVLAKRAGLPRSSTYVTLDKLKSRRLVETFSRSGITYAKCIPVREIADVLKAEERNLQQTLHVLEEQMPVLERMENALSLTPKITFSEGKDAVMKMYESLSREKQYCSFFNPTIVKSIVPECLQIIPEFLRRNGGSARELLVDGAEAREYLRTFASKNHRIAILPKGMTFASDCIICPDRICMITYGENQIAAIEIFSPTLAQTHRTLFDAFWTICDGTERGEKGRERLAKA